MGQYFNIVNKDKEEGYSPVQFGTGLKLTEFAYEDTYFIKYIQDLLANSWMGERIAFVGDYAFPKEMDSEMEKIYWIIQNINDHDRFNGYENVYNHKYLVNLDKKEFIDLEENKEKMKNENDGYIFSPLVLLTAVGNGKGSGDYFGTDQEKVGMWAFDRLMITDKENDIDGYKEIEVNFIEK